MLFDLLLRGSGNLFVVVVVVVMLYRSCKKKSVEKTYITYVILLGHRLRTYVSTHTVQYLPARQCRLIALVFWCTSAVCSHGILHSAVYRHSVQLSCTL